MIVHGFPNNISALRVGIRCTSSTSRLNKKKNQISPFTRIIPSPVRMGVAAAQGVPPPQADPRTAEKTAQGEQL